MTLKKLNMSLAIATFMAAWSAGIAANEMKMVGTKYTTESEVNASRTRPLTGFYGAVTPAVMLVYRISAFIYRK